MRTWTDMLFIAVAVMLFRAVSHWKYNNKNTNQPTNAKKGNFPSTIIIVGMDRRRNYMHLQVQNRQLFASYDAAALDWISFFFFW